MNLNMLYVFYEGVSESIYGGGSRPPGLIGSTNGGCHVLTSCKHLPCRGTDCLI